MVVNINEIEGAIKDLVVEVKDTLNLKEKIDSDVCPGNFIKSDALMTITGRLNSKLGISIPLNCYPFRDKMSHKELSIKEAAKKIFNLVKDGK